MRSVLSPIRDFLVLVLDAVRSQSRYCHLMCLVAGAAMLAPTYYFGALGRYDVVVAGSSRMGGATFHPPDRQTTRNSGVAFGILSLALVGSGIYGLAAKRRPSN